MNIAKNPVTGRARSIRALCLATVAILSVPAALLAQDEEPAPSKGGPLEIATPTGPPPGLVVSVETSRARSALASGLPSKAIFHVRRAAAVTKESPSIHALMGLCMFELERWPEAAQGYRGALDLAKEMDPDLRKRLPIGRWHARLARALLYAGNGEEGAQEIERAIAQGFDPDSLRAEQALAALLQGNYEEAFELGKKPGTGASGVLVVAEALLAQGKAEEALQTLEGVESREALAIASRAYAALGRQEESNASRQKAETLAQRFLDGRRELYEGVRAIQGEDPATAFAKLTAAVEKLPDSPHAHAWMGTLHLLRGENEQARASFDSALELEDGHPIALSGRSDLAHKEGRLPESLRYAEAAVRRDPFSEQLRIKLGSLHLAEGRINDALDDLMSARLLAPEDPLVYLALAGIQDALGNPQLAELFELQAQVLQSRNTGTSVPVPSSP